MNVVGSKRALVDLTQDGVPSTKKRARVTPETASGSKKRSHEEGSDPKKRLEVPNEISGERLRKLGDDLIVAIDPGTVHFGMCINDPVQGVYIQLQIDYTLRRDPGTGMLRQIEVREGDLCRLADHITSDYADIFKKCACITIERQPNLQVRGRGKVAFIPFEHSLRSFCMAKYPRAHVFSVTSQELRTFLGTKGLNHEHRKKLSWWFCHAVLRPEDLQRAKRIFKITDGGINVDALECMLYCIFTQHNFAKLVKAAAAPFKFKAAWRRNTNDVPLRQCIITETLFERKYDLALSKGLRGKAAGEFVGKSSGIPRPVAPAPPPKRKKGK